MVSTFTLKSRMKALREFYTQYRDSRTGESFLGAFQQELRDSKMAGLLE
jgi:hypothetical protein